MTGRERFEAALRGEAVDRVPVFPLLMFFAADRAGITYRTFAGNANALAEAQLRVQERFGLDAITACSDAFRLSADLGGEMAYPEDRPPHLVRPLIDADTDLARLGRPDPGAAGSRMADRAAAVGQMARAAAGRFAVLGWVDMPFAEACSLCGVSQFMLLLHDEPARAHAILDWLTGLVVDFALAQVEAGADMVGAGDAATSLVSAAAYREFALPYERLICEAVQAAGATVKLHVCGNTTHLLADMAGCGADLFNVDHMVPLALARDVYRARGKCFKGNLDPVTQVMEATPEQCRRSARRCIADSGSRGYMLSAGCEIPAATPDAVFAAFCGAVNE